MRALLLLCVLMLSSWLPAHAQKQLPGLTEGQHYRYIEQGAPYQQLAPGMVEVAEVFAYTCPHCAHFSPMLEAWATRLPKQARLVLVPGVFSRDDPFSRIFFAAQKSQSFSVLHPRLFAALHETGELPRNASMAQVEAFASKVQGVNAAALKAALQDDAKLVEQLRQAYEFSARSQIEGTPSLIVAGRYLILGNSYESLLNNANSVVQALLPKQAAPAKPTNKPAAKPVAKPANKPAA